MSIEAVIFDWGGTLSRWAPVELADMWQIAAEHLAARSGRAVSELRARLFAAELRYWGGVNQHQHTGTLADILEAESRALGLDVEAAVMDEVATRHLDAWTPHITHHEEAVSALEQLRAAGLKLGLLSNTHWPEAFIERFLERDGLIALLDVRAYTSSMTHSKPHRVAYEHVLAQLAVSPAQAVMVGDRPIDDVWGSQQLGMRAVWRPHAGAPALGSVRPDAVIQSLLELPEIVANW